MSHIFIDYTQITEGTVGASDTDGTPFVESGWTIPVVIPDGDVAGLLASYDPGSASSPTAADSRKLARLILDALKKTTTTP